MCGFNPGTSLKIVFRNLAWPMEPGAPPRDPMLGCRFAPGGGGRRPAAVLVVANRMRWKASTALSWMSATGSAWHSRTQHHTNITESFRGSRRHHDAGLGGPTTDFYFVLAAPDVVASKRHRWLSGNTMAPRLRAHPETPSKNCCSQRTDVGLQSSLDDWQGWP